MPIILHNTIAALDVVSNVKIAKVAFFINSQLFSGIFAIFVIKSSWLYHWKHYSTQIYSSVVHSVIIFVVKTV